MKHIFAIVVLAALCSPAHASNFYAGAFAHPQDTPPPQTPIIGNPPDMGVLDIQNPVVQSFIQAGQLTAWLEASLATLATNQAADEAKIAAGGTVGPAGPQGIPGPQGPSGVSIPGFPAANGYTINVIANTGSCSTSTLGRNAGAIQFTSADLAFECDFLVWAPQAGNYSISTHLAVTAGTGTTLFHFETPVGTKVASSTFTNANGSANFVAGSAAIPLAQGFQTLRIAIDQAVGTANFNFITLSKQ